ncbi:MAG: potassium channel family protein [Halanaerobiales bacterium]
MNIIVVGGGKVGYFLVKTLVENHDVTLIEIDRDVCREISNELGIPVINGDGSKLSVLRDAGASRADVMVAVSGRDQDNLVTCQIAEKKFSGIRTIARVNNPKNKKAFEKLGVDISISSTSIIAQLIEEEVATEDIFTLLTFKQGSMAIVELDIPSTSAIVNKKIVEVAPDLPENTVLVSIIRKDEDEVIFPKGKTIFRGGDSVLAVTTMKEKEKLENVLKRSDAS